MSLVYELLDKKNKIKYDKQEMRLPLPDRSLATVKKKKSRSLAALIIASLAFVSSTAALAGGWYLYQSMRALQTDHIALDATLVQVSQRVQTLDDQAGKLRMDLDGLGSKVKRNTGENETLKLEVEHAKIEIDGIKQNLNWVINVNKDLQEEVRKLNTQNLAAKTSSTISPFENASQSS